MKVSCSVLQEDMTKNSEMKTWCIRILLNKLKALISANERFIEKPNPKLKKTPSEHKQVGFLFFF